MGVKTKEVGGGPTVGLANDYVSFLQSILNTGGIGAGGSPDAAGSTAGIGSVLMDILSGGKGNAGGNIATLLSKQQERDVNGLRARFGASGGAAFGTPAAFAESQYRAEAAPQITQAITQMQLQAIAPLLGQIGQFSSMGIAPRQLIQQKSGLGQAIGTVAQLGGAALPFLNPAFAAGGGGGGGGAGGYIAPAGQNYNYNQRPGSYYFG